MLFGYRSSLSCLCDLQRPGHGIGDTKKNALLILRVKASVISWADQQPANWLRIFMADDERNSQREDAVLPIATGKVPHWMGCTEPSRNVSCVNSMCCMDRITDENSNVCGPDAAAR